MNFVCNTCSTILLIYWLRGPQTNSVHGKNGIEICVMVFAVELCGDKIEIDLVQYGGGGGTANDSRL